MATLALACLVVLAVVSTALELWRAGRFYARSDGGERFANRQTRYRELRRLLPPHGVVGYLTDKPDAVVTYYLAQYALAPLVLERGAIRPVVVGNFFEPAAAGALAARLGLVLQRDLGEGVMLFAGPSR
jgi:hypothetical protein